MTAINAASVSRVRISQVEEVTRGTTPATPTFLEVPHLNNSALDQNQRFERTAEVRSNRMGGKQVGGNIDAAGPLAIPLKFDEGATLNLLESLFSCDLAHVSVSGAGGNPFTFSINNVDVRASGTLVVGGDPTDGDTVVVNGVTFTWKDTPTLSTHVQITAGQNNTMASALQAAIAASTNVLLEDIVIATVNTATVTITAYTPGTAGNSIAMSETGSAVTASATLSGGVDGVDQITRASGSFHDDGFHEGDQITLTSPTTAANAIINADLAVIDAISSDGLTMNIVSQLDPETELFTTDEAFATGTTLASRSWYGKAGTVRHFFTHEVAYLDLSPVVYEYFRGNEVNTGNFTIPTSGEVTLEMAMIGISGETTNTQISGATLTEADPTVSFAGSVTGSKLYVNGVESPEAESLTISVNNNRSAKFAVGQQTAALIEQGDFDIEMNLSLYFVSKDIQAQYLAGTRGEFEIIVADQQDGHKFALELPNGVITAAPKGNSGQTVVQNCTVYGEEDGDLDTKARIWLIPAASAS